MRRGYKSTEVGVIPEHWRVVRVAEAGQVQGGRQRSPHALGESCRYLRVANVFDGFLKLDDVLEMPFSAAEKERFLLRDGDILLNEGQSIDLVGRSAIYRGIPKDCCFQNTLIRFRAGAIANTEFMHILFQKCLYDGRFAAIALQTTSIAHLGSERFASMMIPLPPLEEQCAIAETLGDANALIEKLDQLIAKKRDIEQAAMQQLLTGSHRLHPFRMANQRYVQSEAGRIPVGWDIRTIGKEVERLDAGVSVNSVDGDASSGVERCGILKTSAVLGGRFLENEFKTVAKGDLHRLKTNPSAGGIIISRANTPELVGECGYVEKDYPNLFLSDKLWITRFRASSKVCARWLSLLLTTPAYKRRMSDSATGSTGSMKNISKEAVLDFPIPFPPPEEQRAIATVVSDMDAEITALERRRDKTRLLKQGMMQELLTGRIRLV